MQDPRQQKVEGGGVSTAQNPRFLAVLVTADAAVQSAGGKGPPPGGSRRRTGSLRRICPDGNKSNGRFVIDLMSERPLRSQRREQAQIVAITPKSVCCAPLNRKDMETGLQPRKQPIILLGVMLSAIPPGARAEHCDVKFYPGNQNVK